MNTPQTAFSRFCVAVAMGLGLGLYYGFLRPLRPKHTHLSDFLFCLGGFWAWIYLSFGVCLGDIRIAYTAGLAVGGFLWEITLGRLLRPVFQKFWFVVGKIFSFLTYPLKFFWKKEVKKR